MIEFSEKNQPLFTEFKNIAALPRYLASTVEKTRDFHTLAKFQMQIVENLNSLNINLNISCQKYKNIYLSYIIKNG